jgi:hypothetical protein
LARLVFWRRCTDTFGGFAGASGAGRTTSGVVSVWVFGSGVVVVAVLGVVLLVLVVWVEPVCWELCEPEPDAPAPGSLTLSGTVAVAPHTASESGPRLAAVMPEPARADMSTRHMRRAERVRAVGVKRRSWSSCGVSMLWSAPCEAA